MGNLRNNQAAAAFLNSTNWPIDWPSYDGCGLSVIPLLSARQANVLDTGDGDAIGHEVIFTQVVDWPFSEDEIGTPFDQENLYGVRTTCARLPMADGGGDTTENFIAVPKSLPSGYTAVGRCGIVLGNNVQDFLGDISPGDSGMLWNHRTAHGLLLDHSDPVQSSRARWAPMNLGQLSQTVGGLFTLYGDPPYSLPGDYPWAAAAISEDHIGFRGGRITLAGDAGDALVDGNVDFEIVAVKTTEFWDPLNQSADSMVTVLYSGTITITGSPTSVIVTLGQMLPPEIGLLYDFFIRTSALSYAHGYPVWVIDLSPRTDVPLPYFASTRNKCAPGGIVIPP